MSFLKENEKFLGDGSRNRKGETLEDFLNKYNPKKYDLPSNTVDIIVAKIDKEKHPMKVLMVKRSNHPSIGMLATPGGFVDIRENLEDAAARELFEETGVKNLPMMQLRTWGDYDRDPRWRVITTTFLSVIENDMDVHAGDDAEAALWMDVNLERLNSGPQENDTSKNVSSCSDNKSGFLDFSNYKSGLWKLTLSNPEQDLKATAKVLVTVSDKLLPEEHYELIESDGLASDHGCLLVQAFLHMRSLGL